MRSDLIKARQRLWEKQIKYDYFPQLLMDINGFRFHWADSGVVEGDCDLLEPYLKCTMPDELLADILRRKAHWNNMEVGCRIRFDRRPNVYLPDVHTLMSFFHL